MLQTLKEYPQYVARCGGHSGTHRLRYTTVVAIAVGSAVHHDAPNNFVSRQVLGGNKTVVSKNMHTAAAKAWKHKIQFAGGIPGLLQAGCCGGTTSCCRDNNHGSFVPGRHRICATTSGEADFLQAEDEGQVLHTTLGSTANKITFTIGTLMLAMLLIVSGCSITLCK